MNVPTFLIAALVAAVLLTIAARGITRRRKQPGGGCGCGCSGCPSNGICHPPAGGASKEIPRGKKAGLHSAR